MKAFALALIFAAMVAMLLFSRPWPNGVGPVSVPLPEGKVNPPLERVGATWPIPSGTELWGYTNHASFGTVVECENLHEFEGGIADGVAVRYNRSPEQITWVPRKSIRGRWIRAGKAQ